MVFKLLLSGLRVGVVRLWRDFLDRRVEANGRVDV
jgi:hypothetical protein